MNGSRRVLITFASLLVLFNSVVFVLLIANQPYLPETYSRLVMGYGLAILLMGYRVSRYLGVMRAPGTSESKPVPFSRGGSPEPAR